MPKRPYRKQFVFTVEVYTDKLARAAKVRDEIAAFTEDLRDGSARVDSYVVVTYPTEVAVNKKRQPQ